MGFESRALAPLHPAPKPRRRPRLRLALAPVAAAVAAVAATLLIVGPDLRLASHYRDTLGEANGKEFESYALRAGDSGAGTVFSYDGSPSWAQVWVDRAHRTGLESAELVLDDGSQVPLRWFKLDSGGSSGGTIPVDPRRISVLRLLGGPQTQPLVAKFSD